MNHKPQAKIQEYIVPETKSETAALKVWRVVLFNDEEHTYDYVVEMLQAVCHFNREQAFRCAVEVDLTGRTIVFIGKKSACETIAAQIHTWGPDHRLLHSRGSMQCAVLS